MRASRYGSGEQQIDAINDSSTRRHNPNGGLAIWFKRILGNPQQGGFLLMTPEGKLSREQRLLKERYSSDA